MRPSLRSGNKRESSSSKRDSRLMMPLREDPSHDYDDAQSVVSGVTYDDGSGSGSGQSSRKGLRTSFTLSSGRDLTGNNSSGRLNSSGHVTTDESGDPVEDSEDFYLGAIAPRCSHRSSAQTMIAMQGFTINHLRYSEVNMHGRDEEFKSLMAAFEDATEHKNRNLVVVSGESGSGKSYLTKQIIAKLQPKNAGCFFLGGKCDRTETHNVPYAAFSLACEKFYASLLELKVHEEIPDVADDDNNNHGDHKRSNDFEMDNSSIDEHGSRYRASVTPAFVGGNGRKSQFFFSYRDIASKLQQSLDAEEKEVLIRTLPSLMELLMERSTQQPETTTNPMRGSSSDTGSDGSPSSSVVRKSTAENNFSQSKIQFNQAFKKLLRTICTFAPVVLTVDDFQWADEASLELLREIMTDFENESGILVIATYQSELVTTEDHPLLQVIQELEKATGQESAKVTNIVINNLTVEGLCGILKDLMSDDDTGRVLELARVVHKKTLGNPLFAIQFMKSLADSGEALAFSFNKMYWEWDLEAIEKATNVTQNVLDLMVKKLSSLPDSISKTLPLLASLGFSFPKPSLQIAIEFGNDHFHKQKNDSASKDGTKNDSATKDDDTTPKDDKHKDSTTNDDDTTPKDDQKNEMTTKNDDTTPKDQKNDSTTNDDDTTLTFEKYVERCTKEGILESYGGGWYRWVHDKLAEAAVSLVEPQELEQIQFLVGQRLLDELSPDELERNLFVVVALLNTGVTSDACEAAGLMNAERNLQISELNLRAGKKAIQSSLFLPSVAYLNQGIALLPQNHWQSHYELSLELYSVAAQAEYSIGNFERMQHHCDVVISQQDRPLLDKRRVYNAMLDSIGAQDRMGDAAKLCVEVLAKLGCRFPKYGAAFCTIAGLLRTVHAKKKRTPEMIAKYKTMTDPAKIWAMNLLDKLFTFWYQDKNDNVPLAILKSQRWTIKYGVCDVSMPNFASVGFMLGAFLGDFDGGEIYARHSLELLEKSGSEAIKSRTLLVAYGSNLHWKIPFNDCVKPLLEGYNVGMKMGDVESALYCVLFYLWFSLALGAPLTVLARDFDTYSRQMIKFQQKKHLSWTEITLQVILNLLGAEGNSNTYRLVGEVMDEDELMKNANDVHILKPALNLFQIYAMFYFTEYERIVDIIEANEDGYFEKSIPGISMLMVNAFQSAIACIQVARKTGKSKYKKLAKKFKDKIDGWVKKGNPNVLQYQALVDAEWLALLGKKHEAEAKYEVAILMAGRRGLMQDHAVSHEMCSEFFFSNGNRTDGLRHAEMAVELYEEWGAMAVAERLKENKRLCHMFLPPEVIGDRGPSKAKAVDITFADVPQPLSSRSKEGGSFATSSTRLALPSVN